MKKKSSQAKRAIEAKPQRLRAKLVRIGNSRGVRLPKILIEKAGLGDKVTLHAIGNAIVIERADDPRVGWDKAMRDAAAEHGNELTDEDREWLNAPLGPFSSGIG